MRGPFYIQLNRNGVIVFGKFCNEEICFVKFISLSNYLCNIYDTCLTDFELVTEIHNAYKLCRFRLPKIAQLLNSRRSFIAFIEASNSRVGSL